MLGASVEAAEEKERAILSLTFVGVGGGVLVTMHASFICSNCNACLNR
jgi:hypothetical protein